ncbi:DUF1727 domain-containing protein [Candidatus Saccharibacteria bacterium]|jgi:UDP-N-acetylmuramyl tripeptide synthase|nr:DUF1727 domain-containing protein [Candidatus Saccharibacteria bacterium]MBP9131531.1 DUF1727 domain-containing protein [Candidatus Saccharibacteria bacterium]
MFILSIIIGKLTIFGLRVAGKGGSALPGLVIEKINNSFLEQFSKSFNGKVVLVTGTNGKTTTTKVLGDVLLDQGETVLSNRSGSNIKRGVISSIIENSSVFGKSHYNYAVFEIDEAYAPIVAKALRPHVLVALNIFRDQLDRFSELDKTYQYISEAAEFSDRIVINIDDPLLSAIKTRYSKSTTSFGAVARIRKLLPTDNDLHASKTASKAYNPDILLYETQRIGNREQIQINCNNKIIKFSTQLIGVHNAINLAAVFATLKVLGMSDSQFENSIKKSEPAFGRGETVTVSGRDIILMLAKNPAGFNQALLSLKADGITPSIIGINDNLADGRDVSWLWDVNFEEFVNNDSKIICTGTRAFDIAVRLKYAHHDLQSIVIEDLDNAISKLLVSKSEGTKAIVATYTTMLEIRKILSSRVYLKEFWK